MESIQRQDKVLFKQSNHCISIFNLGKTAEDMLETWKILKENESPVLLEEFPDVDVNLMIEDKPLMELILEFAIQIEKNKKKIAREKQAEGIARAKKKGIKLGRREKEIPDNFINVYKNIMTKKMTLKKATELLEVDYKTLKKWIKQYQK